MCPTFKSVLNGVCRKVNYRNLERQKPCMILATCNLQILKVSEVHSSMVDSIDIANDLPVTVNSGKVFLVA